MDYTIAVENSRCGGCANSIRSGLLERRPAQAVEVDVARGEVQIAGTPEWRSQVAAAPARMGYPAVDSVEGRKAAAARARSFVRRAIGRIDGARAGEA